jgi:hypothetical protein
MNVFLYMQHKVIEMCGIHGVLNIVKILYCIHHSHATILRIGSITTGLEKLDDVTKRTSRTMAGHSAVRIYFSLQILAGN